MGAMREVAWFGCALALAGCRFNFGATDRDGGGSGSDTLAGDVGDGPGSDGPMPDGRPASTCAQLTGVGMCDGFEASTLDARWIVSTSSGSTVTLDTSRAYRGGTSFHSHAGPTTAGTSSYATIRTVQGTNGMVTGTVHVRAWAYYVAPHPTQYDQTLAFVTTTGVGVAMGNLNGFMRSNDFTYGQSQVSTTTPVPLDRWVCLEFAMPSGIEGTSRLYVDDVEVTDIALTTPVGMPQPAPDHVYIGLEWYQPSASIPATDAWFDEIIVDSQPIGCAK